MTAWPTSAIADALEGTWLAQPPVAATGASIDTRTLRPGNVFFALRGEHADGHAFIDRAAAGGASVAVVDREVSVPDGGMGALLVADARSALARLAEAYRARFGTTRVIGVTGSAGKTTTVRLIDAALGASLRGSASERSFNNELGVPLTILNAATDADYLVCEIGTNAPGEIGALSRLARPDIAVVTTVGRAHLEGFGTVEAIAREKASIARGLRPGGCLLANADVPALRKALPNDVSVRTFGRNADADTRITGVSIDAHGLHVMLADGFHARAALAGAHNAFNVAAAVCVARLMGAGDPSIVEGLARARSEAQRLHVEDLAGEHPVRLIDDAYNANPDSTLAALGTLADLGEGRRRVAILGDMLELGAHATEAHLEIAQAAAGIADLRVHVGPMSARAGAEAPGGAVLVEEPTDEALAEITRLIDPGDAVLVKASRAIGLERVCKAIRDRFAMIGGVTADNRGSDAGLPQ